MSQVLIGFDREHAELSGAQVGSLVGLRVASLNVRVANQELDGPETFEVYVWCDEFYQKDIQALTELRVDTPFGKRVPLALLAPQQGARASRLFQVSASCR